MVHDESIFEALMLNSPVAIVTVDLNGEVGSVNPAFEKLFGYSHDEVIGKNLDLLISTPESYYEVNSLTKRIVSFGETIRTTSKRRKKDQSLSFLMTESMRSNFYNDPTKRCITLNEVGKMIIVITETCSMCR